MKVSNMRRGDEEKEGKSEMGEEERHSLTLFVLLLYCCL